MERAVRVETVDAAGASFNYSHVNLTLALGYDPGPAALDLFDAQLLRGGSVAWQGWVRLNRGRGVRMAPGAHGRRRGLFATFIQTFLKFVFNFWLIVGKL